MKISETISETWESMMENAIFIKNGVYAVDQEIIDRSDINSVGFYIYTKKSSFEKFQYKGGQTINGISRIKTQASDDESILIIDWIPSDLAKIAKYDQKIHNALHQQGKCEWLHRIDPTNAPGTEWSRFPKRNPEQLWSEYIGDYQKRENLELTVWQLMALDQILTAKKNNKQKIMAELAARFGKTTLYLSLFDLSEENVMVVCSYYLTALSSFKKEISRWNQFSNYFLLDLSNENFCDEYNEVSQNKNAKIIIFASLCGSTIVEKNSDFIKNIKNKLTIVDEADYGAHTQNVTPLVNKIGDKGIIILTTGTNSERAKGLHTDIDYFFKETYFDMLMKKNYDEISLDNSEILVRYNRSNKFEKFISDVRFYRFDWSKLASVVNSTNKEFAPSFTKESQDVNKSSAFWSGMYDILIGQSTEMNANDYSLLNVINQSGEELQSVIQFVSMRKSEMKKLHKIAKSRLSKTFDIYIVNGDVVSGKNAEEQVNDWIRVARKNNKHVWIIASLMCQRSFSIPEINVAVLSYDNGDKGATIQKMSRSLTAGPNKKIGHIISLSIDGNRDGKIAPIILETANKIADKENIDSVKAIRRVMKTMPIFQMQTDGYLYELEPDLYAQEIFASSNSHRLVVNKDRLFDFNVNDQSYTIIMNTEILKINGSSSPVYMNKSKTFMDKKCAKVNLDNKKDEELNLLINKLMSIIDNIDYSAKMLKNLGIDLTYDAYLGMLDGNQNLSDGVGLTGIQLNTLISEKYINKKLLSLYIECGVK
jgi:hypothetical protein